MTTERYIAVDNVCAWPNLTKMPDGTIVATIFNQPCHGQWEGDVECWASESGGRFWHLRGTPAPHEPGTNRMNVAAGLAANGDLVVLASGWSNRPPVGHVAGFERLARRLPPWVCRSADGGRTWSVNRAPCAVRLPEGMDSEDGDSLLFKPFGDIVQLPGALAASFYHDGGTVWVVFSDDDGRTWTRSAVISDQHRGETALLRFLSGRFLAVARTEGEVGGFTPDVGLQLFTSENEGRTWDERGVLTGPSQHPGHLCALPDGRLLLTFGMRDIAGIGVRLSTDEGRTWGEPRILVQLEPADLGYPATVPGDGDTLVTAWYCSGIAAHQRYHMGVVLWNPDKDPTANELSDLSRQ